MGCTPDGGTCSVHEKGWTTMKPRSLRPNGPELESQSGRSVSELEHGTRRAMKMEEHFHSNFIYFLLLFFLSLSLSSLFA